MARQEFRRRGDEDAIGGLPGAPVGRLEKPGEAGMACLDGFGVNQVLAAELGGGERGGVRNGQREEKEEAHESNCIKKRSSGWPCGRQWVQKAFGDDYGRTVDSFCCDSFGSFFGGPPVDRR